jgi:hypothetical protein
MGVNRPDWLVEGSSSSRRAIGVRFLRHENNLVFRYPKSPG